MVEDPPDIAVPRAPTVRHAFRNMDDVDVERILPFEASATRPRLVFSECDEGKLWRALRMSESHVGAASS